jgi:hypothetical protein
VNDDFLDIGFILDDDDFLAGIHGGASILDDLVPMEVDMHILKGE